MGAKQTGAGPTSNRAARLREIDEQVAATPPVRLRPILGMAPGTYLTLAIGLVGALAFLLVLVLPGLRFNGTIVAVTSSPSGAAVHIDGQFASTTPAELRVPRGPHTLRVSRPSFHPYELMLDLDGRILASLFFPRRASHHVAMEIEDVRGLLDDALADFSSSPLLSSSITAAAQALQPRDTQIITHFVHNIIQQVTPARSESATRALFIATTGAAPPSGAAIGHFVAFIAQYVNKYRGSPAILAKASPLQVRPRVVQSDWFRAWRESEQDRLLDWMAEQASPKADLAGSLLVGSRTFHEIPAGEFVMGDTSRVDGFAARTSPVEEMPHVVEVPRFFAGAQEVSKGEFAAFVAENSQWAPANRAALAAKGLATSDYLGDWSGDGPRVENLDAPVTYVSFYAAEAYTRWLSEHPAVRGAGLIARLPYEPEWERAARGGLPNSRYPTGSEARTARVSTPLGGPSAVGFSAANGYGLRDTIGNVWEWTGDWYSPNAYYLRSTWEQDYGPDRSTRVGAERVVRGGSFADERASVAVYTRGAQPPEWCTPVLGFRVVLAER